MRFAKDDRNGTQNAGYSTAKDYLKVNTSFQRTKHSFIHKPEHKQPYNLNLICLHK
ncbi:hypothetical protein C7445_11621 [Alicyclobacillus sacchari]|uniref:Uncharacterized protein n=1 Tax=Alicyclobacillus sacchari TaxID=392010 RepID=A0A4R8LGS9_9BACL|nr:hypothetical protein C7445_11621 [Alicyclobacillus sacchari]